MICIYHSRDLDGWMSAAIVKLKYPEVELLGWDYGMPIPILDPTQAVIMVDISFPKEDMKQIAGQGLVWIDHHISAIKDLSGLGFMLQGIRDPQFAACELTWKHLFPDEQMPEIVHLLGRYDCFGHKGTDEEQKVLEFQYGAREAISNPEDAFYYLTHEDGEQTFAAYITNVDRILESGRAIYKYLCTEAKQIYARKFDLFYGSYRFGCVNECRFNPVNFGIDYHKDGYDGFACFHYQYGKWIYSLYNDNGLVDCSEIAKAMGGGGHKGAAGFQTEEVLLNTIVVK
jgi:oligoribonuclease NrnB/cAMP/cGMP phosphodiesterase (DHH superfamily)